ncbi:alpha/beta fold hydrolase [Thalassotalea ganghwensis]
MKRLFSAFWLLLLIVSSQTWAKNIEKYTEEYIDSKHGKIYIATLGEGEPVIIVNGGPGAGHRVFLGHLDFIANAGFKIVYFDDTGRGRSTREIDDKFTPQMTTDDIETIRKHLKVDKVTLLGHSFGGIPAMQYVLQYPNNVRKLMMINASYDDKSQQMNADNFIHIMKTRYPEKWENLSAIAASGISVNDMVYLKELFKGPFATELQWYDANNSEKLFKVPSKDPRDKFNLQVYADIIGDRHDGIINGTLVGTSIINKLDNYKTPTLITAGRYDNASTPQLVLRLKKMLPQEITSYTIFEKSGHWPWIEEEHFFQTTILGFLK